MYKDKDDDKEREEQAEMIAKKLAEMQMKTDAILNDCGIGDDIIGEDGKPSAPGDDEDEDAKNSPETILDIGPDKGITRTDGGHAYAVDFLKLHDISKADVDKANDVLEKVFEKLKDAYTSGDIPHYIKQSAGITAAISAIEHDVWIKELPDLKDPQVKKACLLKMSEILGNAECFEGVSPITGEDGPLGGLGPGGIVRMVGDLYHFANACKVLGEHGMVHALDVLEKMSGLDRSVWEQRLKNSSEVIVQESSSPAEAKRQLEEQIKRMGGKSRLVGEAKGDALSQIWDKMGLKKKPKKKGK